MCNNKVFVHFDLNIFCSIKSQQQIRYKIQQLWHPHRIFILYCFRQAIEIRLSCLAWNRKRILYACCADFHSATLVLTPRGAVLRVSLEDVARRAKTSKATASRVISGSSYPVSIDARTRVLQAVEELSYRPNAVARALATKESRIIGVIVGDVMDPYFAEISRGVEDFARPFGLLTIVCNADRSVVAETAYLEMLLQHHAAGVLLAGGTFSKSPDWDALKKAVANAGNHGARVVALAERGLGDVPLISADDRAVLYDLAKCIISLGHRRIAFIEGPTGFTTSELRLRGFLKAMEESDIEPFAVVPGGFDLNSGRSAALRLLGTQLPDAIIASTDECAVGVLTALRQAGIEVPGQVSVAGVDGTRYSDLMDLTTVRCPTHELGAMAARQLIEWNETTDPIRTYLPHRLIERGTTMRRAGPCSASPRTTSLDLKD